MTTRPVPNSITLADLDGVPTPTALVEASYASLRDRNLALFEQHIPLWDSHPDRPLYRAIELFAAILFSSQEGFNDQIAKLDPRNWDDSAAQTVGALLGVLRKDGESLAPYIERVLNRQVDIDDTGTYLGLIATMLKYPDLNIISAHAAVEATNRDVYNCYALKLVGNTDTEPGDKLALTEAEREAFASYTAPAAEGAQPITSGYLNARGRADFGKFYRLQPVATVNYAVALKIFFDDTLHAQDSLDTIVRNATIKWAFEHDAIGEELRPRLLESTLISTEGVHDAKATITTNPPIAADADDVLPADDPRHYRGPTEAERDSGITLTWETI